jgi:hypothetical protein
LDIWADKSEQASNLAAVTQEAGTSFLTGTIAMLPFQTATKILSPSLILIGLLLIIHGVSKTKIIFTAKI